MLLITSLLHILNLPVCEERYAFLYCLILFPYVLDIILYIVVGAYRRIVLRLELCSDEVYIHFVIILFI